ncbi:MAG: type II toxin-antitoxin system VapC family toxin [Bacteroidales bacterium]|nr:type II toxin-antitoxin system VapC family toxin [Bacteroidales bacterium]
MNLILDTHTFIWFSEDDPLLSAKAKSLIEDSDNNCFVSTASIWEMAIKISLNKLKIKIEFKKLREEIINHDFDLIPISFEHTIIIKDLTFHHRDPFDRLLIAQSIVEEFSIISKDKIFDKYKIKRIW